jgi:predicted small integral membrane protein
MFIQVVSIIGALLVLGAYAAHQARRLHAHTIAYQLMNLFGGFFLFLAALTSRQVGLMVVEGSWTVISLGGLWRVVFSLSRAKRGISGPE